VELDPQTAMTLSTAGLDVTVPVDAAEYEGKRTRASMQTILAFIE
jgi:hypothetical protein